MKLDGKEETQEKPEENSERTDKMTKLIKNQKSVTGKKALLKSNKFCGFVKVDK